jgi:hypothetical protein
MKDTNCWHVQQTVDTCNTDIWGGDRLWRNSRNTHANNKHTCQYGPVASLRVLTRSPNFKPNTDGTRLWVQCRAEQRSAVQSSAVQSSAAQRSAVQCRAEQCSAEQRSAVQCRAVQCSAEQCSAVQCSAVQRSAAQSSAVQCSAEQRRAPSAPFKTFRH